MRSILMALTMLLSGTAAAQQPDLSQSGLVGKLENPTIITDPAALPKTFKEVAIDNKYFSYQSRSAIKGRTLTIRREFVSKVAGQVCAKEMEAEISEPMQHVARSLRVQMSF